MYHTFISFQALTPKLNPSPPAATIHTLVTLTHLPTCNSQYSWPPNTHSEPKPTSMPEMKPLLVRIVFSNHFCATEVRLGPRSPNQPSHFYSLLQQPPCAQHPVGDSTHLPLCHSCRTKLCLQISPVDHTLGT